MSLKIIFAGTPEFAVLPFKALLKSSHNLIAAYTQPDRPAGRGQLLQESPIKQLANTHHIPVYQPKSLKDPKEQEILKNLNPDLMIVAAYGLILPKTILDIPKLGCINIHASLLPRWRGASPIQQAILAGDLETGISIMQMDEGLDTGDVLSIHPCSITPEDTAETLHNKLAVIGSEAILTTLRELENNKLSPLKQNNQFATHAPKILKLEAKINWNESAVILDRKIRAYNPWPIAFTEINKQLVRIWKAKPLDYRLHLKISSRETLAGTIINASENSLEVKTGEGILQILELQLAGAKRLQVNEILKSKSDIFKIGSVFESKKNILPNQ